MEATWIVVLSLIVFPLSWLGITSFVMFLISFGGWRGLAKKYQFENDVPDPTYRFVTVWISIIGRYNRGMNISLVPRGIIIRPFILFRVAHPPLLLPWEMLKSAKEKRILFGSYAELIFDDGKNKVEIHTPTAILKNTYLLSKVGI